MVAERPRVFCMEGLDPVSASSQWVRELVKLAGGIDELSRECDELGREGGESASVSWDEIVAWNPEVLVIMPSGFNLQQTMKQIWNVFGPYSAGAAKSGSGSTHRFFELAAVRNSRVYAVDANSCFASSNPRVIEGMELLARLIHPALFTDEPLSPEFANAFQPVDVSLLQGAFEPEKDYYMENGAFVITGSYLRRRGYCCGSGCRHCPYPVG